jgi:hypothetical protein
VEDLCKNLPTQLSGVRDYWEEERGLLGGGERETKTGGKVCWTVPDRSRKPLPLPPPPPLPIFFLPVSLWACPDLVRDMTINSRFVLKGKSRFAIESNSPLRPTLITKFSSTKENATGMCLTPTQQHGTIILNSLRS